ncbi:hypothetical protein RM788_06420 [Umezawaea sp. Da 62-37]|nr:hypothetical protein [Umezawaea sp. Da 62-37]WNV87916.1 hypothetical protein RM788_06420 [Umezawaea sp. Da 62-37]
MALAAVASTAVPPTQETYCNGAAQIRAQGSNPPPVWRAMTKEASARVAAVAVRRHGEPVTSGAIANSMGR